MITPDTNVLLYAYNDDAPQYKVAKKWFESQFDVPTIFGFTWPAITAFIRISTNPRMWPAPFSLTEAMSVVNEWLEHPKSVMLLPTDRHWSIVQTIALGGQARGSLFMDAHLAAIAIEHGAVLATNDRDFTRFSGLKTVNPLEDE